MSILMIVRIVMRELVIICMAVRALRHNLKSNKDIDDSLKGVESISNDLEGGKGIRV